MSWVVWAALAWAPGAVVVGAVLGPLLHRATGTPDGATTTAGRRVRFSRNVPGGVTDDAGAGLVG